MHSVTVFGRRWFATALMVVVATGLLLALIHTPIVRSWMLSYAARTLDERFDIRLEATRIDFNLLTLDFELHQVSVASSAQPDLPFLTAERARANLPWSAVLGTLSFSTLTADRPKLSLLQSADGAWNLPEEKSREESASVEDGRLLPAIERLTVPDLEIEVRAPGYDVIALGISVVMAAAPTDPRRLEGSLQVSEHADVRWGERDIVVEALEAGVAVYGETLEIESLGIRLPEGRLHLEGDVRSLTREPGFDLTYDGSIVLSAIGEWWRAGHQVAGQAVVDGTVTGSMLEPRVTSHIAASDVRWADLSALRFSADVRADRESVSVDEARLVHGMGAVDASAQWSIGAGIVSGHGELAWTAWHLSAVELTAEVRSRQPTSRRGRLPVAGAVMVELRAGRWRAETTDLALPGLPIRGRVSGVVVDGEQALAESTLSGDVTADVTDLARVAEAFGVSGTDVDIQGTAAIEATLAGTLDVPAANGHVRDVRARFLGIDDIEVDAAFLADRHGIRFEELTGRLRSNRVEGNAAFGFADASIDAALAMTLPDTALLAPALPEALAPGGHIEGQLVIGGSLADPMLDATVAGRQITISGRTVDQLAATVRLDGDLVVIDTLEARQNDGRMSLSGRYAVSSGVHEISASGSALSLEALLPDGAKHIAVGGRISFDLESSGPWSDLRGDGHARVEALEVDGRALGPVDVALSVAHGSMHVDATMPTLNATARVEVGMGESSSLDMAAEFQRTDLQKLWQPGDQSTPNVSGIASFSLTVTGDYQSLAGARINANLRELSGQFGPTRVRLVEPGGLEYDDGHVRTDRIRLLVNGTRLTVEGRLGSAPTDRLAATLAGDLSDVGPIVAWLASPGEPIPIGLGGSVDTTLAVTGSLDDPTVSARMSVDDGIIDLPRFPPARSVDLDVSYDAHTLTLHAFRAGWQGATVRAEGALPTPLLADWVPAFLIGPPSHDAQGRLTMRIDEITANVLEPFLDQDALGELEADASARLDLTTNGLALEDVRGVLSFDRLDLTASAIPLSQRRETRLELSDGRLDIRSLDLGNSDDYFTLGGTVDLSGNPTADLSVTAELDLRTASAFIPNGATEGDAFLIVNILGSLDDPEVTGTLELRDAGLRVRAPQLILSDLNGALFLTGDTIQLHELSGEANGGPLAISGELDVVGMRPEGDVRIVGRGIAMELPAGVRTELDTDMTFSLSAETAALRGDITVQRGAYREAFLLTGGLLAAFQERESVTIIGVGDVSPLDAVDLNVRVVTAEDIVVDNNYIDAAVAFDLRILGTPAAPALTGRAALAEGGRLRLGNRVYEIDNGSVDFIDPSEIEPDLDITARTRVSGRDITVTISGVPDALSTSFQSDRGGSQRVTSSRSC